jgi:hypothetical protein
MKLLIVHFSLFSCYLLPNVFLSTLVTLTFSLCSFQNLTDHVSHPYNICRIVVLYVLMFMLLGIRWKDERFWIIR